MFFSGSNLHSICPCCGPISTVLGYTINEALAYLVQPLDFKSTIDFTVNFASKIPSGKQTKILNIHHVWIISEQETRRTLRLQGIQPGRLNALGSCQQQTITWQLPHEHRSEKKKHVRLPASAVEGICWLMGFEVPSFQAKPCWCCSKVENLHPIPHEK